MCVIAVQVSSLKVVILIIVFSLSCAMASRGQAEREFRVEVEAIGHVRHKNLVRLLGYCVEGTQRMLVYEYVNNGNLEQWLHGAMGQKGSLTWDARMKIILGIAKALAYLHEAVEPKVVHRDIKSSNILVDEDFNAKVSDFGLAKLLGAGKSHIATQVMGTFGYVAPEYANTGLLNETSDIYSFGVLLFEVITGRDPVDYRRPPDEINLVEWLKWMIGNRRSEEVVDPRIVIRPSTKALKKALLTALRCVDPDSEKRPTMGRVVQMLEPHNPRPLEHCIKVTQDKPRERGFTIPGLRQGGQTECSAGVVAP
ncbi:STYKc [Musa troglodytarum]|uniref:non-specific serine/threonine protein kinase n=1 Tax=Musa troglodytarum TaxID=320322 RepID=A0A9E7JK35_9LILI|nr:STYKc [Musa troglodytarum]